MKTLSHEKRNRIDKGKNGICANPKTRHLPPTDKQLRELNRIFDELEKRGVKAKFALESNKAWATDATVCSMMIRNYGCKLNNICYGEDKDYRYVNLCKDPKTGKKIKYLTKQKYGFPIGYEFIGQLEVRRYVPGELDSKPGLIPPEAL